MVYRNRGRFVSGALVAAAVHFWISQNILGSLAAEQMRRNTEASFARAKKQMEEWDSRPSGARRAPAIVIPTPIPLPGAPQVPRPQPHFLNPPKNASRFSLRLFVALPGTALAQLVAPPSSEAPAQRASFYPFEMPSTASRVAQHAAVGILFSLLVLLSATRFKSLAHDKSEESVTLPPSGARSFFTRYNYSLIFVLNVCLMSLVSMTAQRDVILNDGFVNPVAKKRFLDQLFLSITSYPLGAWHAVEDLRGVPSTRGALGGDWTFASMLLFPVCILLILESIRLLLSRMTRREAGTGTKRSIFRTIIVSAGGSVAASLLGFQIWVDSGRRFDGIDRLFAPSQHNNHQSNSPSYQPPPSGVRKRSPREIDWDTVVRGPWLYVGADFQIPPEEKTIELPKNRFSGPLNLRPTEVKTLPSVCSFEQQELDEMREMEITAEISRSWKALLASPDSLQEIVPPQLRAAHSSDADAYGLPKGLLSWFRQCHMRRLAMFGKAAAPVADAVASFLSDERLDHVAEHTLSKIGPPSLGFLVSNPSVRKRMEVGNLSGLLATLEVAELTELLVRNPEEATAYFRPLMFAVLSRERIPRLPDTLSKELERLQKSSIESHQGVRNLAYLVDRISRADNSRSFPDFLRDCPYVSRGDSDIVWWLTREKVLPAVMKSSGEQSWFWDAIQFPYERHTFVATETYLLGRLRKKQGWQGNVIGGCEDALFTEGLLSPEQTIVGGAPPARGNVPSVNQKNGGVGFCGAGLRERELERKAMMQLRLLSAISSLSSLKEPMQERLRTVADVLADDATGVDISLDHPQFIRDGLPLIRRLPKSASSSVTSNVDLLRSIGPKFDSLPSLDGAPPRLQIAAELIKIAKHFRRGLSRQNKSLVEEARVMLKELLPRLYKKRILWWLIAYPAGGGVSRLNSIWPVGWQSVRRVTEAIATHPQLSLPEAIELVALGQPHAGKARLSPIQNGTDIEAVSKVLRDIPVHREDAARAVMGYLEDSGNIGTNELRRIAEGAFGPIRPECRFGKWQRLAWEKVGRPGSPRCDQSAEDEQACSSLRDLIRLGREEELNAAITGQAGGVIANPCCDILSAAIERRSRSIVEHLLERGAAVNVRTAKETPLMVAAKFGKAELIEPLINRLRAKVAENKPLESEALIAGLEHPAVVEALLKLGVTPGPDPDGDLPLFKALAARGAALFEEGTGKSQRLPLNKLVEVADPLARDGNGNTIFHLLKGARLPQPFLSRLVRERRAELLDALAAENCNGEFATFPPEWWLYIDGSKTASRCENEGCTWAESLRNAGLSSEELVSVSKRLGVDEIFKLKEWQEPIYLDLLIQEILAGRVLTD